MAHPVLQVESVNNAAIDLQHVPKAVEHSPAPVAVALPIPRASWRKYENAMRQQGAGSEMARRQHGDIKRRGGIRGSHAA